jgi:superfamily II DNA or RNA helicase
LSLEWVKAEDLVEGDLVAMASSVVASDSSVVPEGLPELLAWQITEGYENLESPWLAITQHDDTVLNRLEALFNLVAPYSPSGRITKNDSGKSVINIWCADYRRMLEESGYTWGYRSKDKRFPAWVFGLGNQELAVLLRAVFDAEGSVGRSSVELTLASKLLLTQVQYLLLRLGIRCSYHYKKGRATNGLGIDRLYWRLSISGEDLRAFSDLVGFDYKHKQEALLAASEKPQNPNCGIPFGEVVSSLRQIGLLNSLVGSRNRSLTTVDAATAISFVAKVRSVLSSEGLSPWEKFTKSDNPGYKVGEQCRKVISTVNANRDLLLKLAESVEETLAANLRFERVTAVKLGQSGGYVYDIEVESYSYDSANYVAGIGGFVVHNSLGAIAASEAFGKPYTVIGPAAVRPTFKSEQRKFTDQTLPSDVISYQKALQPEGVAHPESLVVDEAQRIVNPGSRQSQAVQEAARKAKQVLMLSGTPIVNRPGDLAPIFSILTDRQMSPAGFEARYMGQEAKPRTWSDFLSGKDREYHPVIRHRDELKSLLDGKVDWYAPAKPNVATRYSDHEVEMSPEQSKLYRAMYGKIPWKLRLGLDGSTDMTPTELEKLKSFLSGPRQVGLSDYPFASHKDPLKSFYGSSKLQLAYSKLQELLKNDDRTKGIVYSNFPRAGLEPYRAALLHNKIPHILFDGTLSDAERDAAVQSFNEGRSRVALVGPAGAEGISLRGAQIVQALDPHWQEARMRQATARGIRFDSHTHLPPELQNVEVQRFISRLPAKDRTWLQALRLAPRHKELQPAADDYLRSLSDNKEKSNKLILDLLREVGTRKVARTVVKTSNLQTGANILNLPAVKIDRPKGFQKTFQTPNGPLATTYPVDYGYFDGIINPDDKEGADVFMGTGGETGLHGRFMKGKNLTGKWEPDERKWYANLTPDEHKAVLHFYHQQDPSLLADYVSFKTHKDLLGDLDLLRAPADPKATSDQRMAQLTAALTADPRKVAQYSRTAVIIRGNPKHFPADGSADRFYRELADHVTSMGYRTSFDDGLPQTDPPPADAWIGHSRGAGRFDYALPNQLAIPMGSHRKGSINHPEDRAFMMDGSVTPAHFTLTPDMRNELTKRLQYTPTNIKMSRAASVTVQDTCNDCGGVVSAKVSDIEGLSSSRVPCPNCGKSSFALMSDSHRSELIAEAASITDKEPSHAQRQAGNYRKGKFDWYGLTIAIENPKDSIRRGVDKSGKMWETKLHDHYGYILKHVSEADGDHMDVFVSAEPAYDNRHVYVVDQVVDDKFDEHKAIIMAKDANDAKAIYKRNYQPEWKGFSNLSTLNLSEFKDWLATGDTSKPLFVPVPKADIDTATATRKVAEEAVKKVDKTGDDSGGYGEIILCKRQNKAWIIVGDWWSREVCDVYEKEFKKALPDYEWEIEAESHPPGYETANHGDWARIK